jgi:hypothetical protein
MRSISVRMWAKFSVYGDILNAPEALTMWAKYAIYEAIDKIPQICHTYGSMWSKMDYGGVKGRAQLHVYLITYKLVVIDQELVVYFMVDHL